jgi:hypothetical protein
VLLGPMLDCAAMRRPPDDEITDGLNIEGPGSERRRQQAVDWAGKVRPPVDWLAA